MSVTYWYAIDVWMFPLPCTGSRAENRNAESICFVLKKSPISMMIKWNFHSEKFQAKRRVFTERTNECTNKWRKKSQTYF